MVVDYLGVFVLSRLTLWLCLLSGMKVDLPPELSEKKGGVVEGLFELSAGVPENEIRYLFLFLYVDALLTLDDCRLFG